MNKAMLFLACTALCGILASCGEGDSGHPRPARWVQGPGCAELAPRWREEMGVLDGHSPLLRFDLAGGGVRADPGSLAEGMDWRGTLKFAATLNPKPILELRVDSAAQCAEFASALKEVSEAFECTRTDCVLSAR
jgi:hypothetical protein